jgi:hypothetical protein
VINMSAKLIALLSKNELCYTLEYTSKLCLCASAAVELAISEKVQGARVTIVAIPAASATSAATAAIAHQINALMWCCINQCFDLCLLAMYHTYHCP